ncbi:MAG: CapA family protein [Patescibacteria group bacterium]|jgi:poly-gamma-glutamate synthesis protein (capsule biosynthesis protein)
MKKSPDQPKLNKQTIIYAGIALLIVAAIVMIAWSLRAPSPVKTAAVDEKNRPLTVISMLAVGDINLGRQTGQKILAGDANYAFEYLSEALQKPDITFGNLESQLADLNGETQSPTNEYRFAGPPAGADGLKSAGFDIVSIANNHMWDYGKDRLFETIDNLERVGVPYVGASKDPAKVYQPTILDIRQQKVAFFAATDILNGYEKSGATEYVAWADPDKLIPAVEAAQETADWIIVSMHWGTEYSSTPKASQIELAHKLIDAGAYMVIGSHPHVPQGVEEYNGGVILYSLGNFAFWQPMTYWTQHSFMADIQLRPSGRVDYTPIPINSGWQPRLSSDTATEEKILKYIAKLSEPFTK